MKARDLMTTQLYACSADSPSSEAARLMWEHDCGSIPITNPGGHLLGMLTDRDICMAALTRGRPLDQMTTASIMSRDTVTCSPDDSLRVVEELMREHRLRRIPVVEAGNLVGLIGLGDLVREVSAGGMRGTLTAPGLLKTLESVYEPRGTAAAAE
jgi:CBS domain-containing protein